MRIPAPQRTDRDVGECAAVGKYEKVKDDEGDAKEVHVQPFEDEVRRKNDLSRHFRFPCFAALSRRSDLELGLVDDGCPNVGLSKVLREGGREEVRGVEMVERSAARKVRNGVVLVEGTLEGVGGKQWNGGKTRESLGKSGRE